MNCDSLFSGIDFTSLNAQSSNSSPVNSTISNSNMNNNGNMVQPLNTNHNIQQFDQQQFAMANNGTSLPSSPTIAQFVLTEKDREIYHKNNLRLQQMEREIRVFHTYGNACDELFAWLNDDRAYNKMNEAALVACIVAIYEKHVEHGRWSGMQILKTASERCAGLSDKARAIIKKCHNEASNSLTPRRPSESSITSTGSGNLTMTNSPASLRSSSNLNTPQSPNNSTEFFPTTNFQSPVKNILGTNVKIAPSPTLSTSSPLASPHIAGSDINNMQQRISPQINHAGVPPNTVLNDQSNAIRSNQQLSKQQQMQIALSQQQQQQKKHAIQQQMLQQHQIQQQLLHKQELEQQQRQQQMQQLQQQQQQQQLKQQHQQQQHQLLVQQQQLRMQQNAAYQAHPPQYYAQQPAQAQPQYNGHGPAPAPAVGVPQQNSVPVSPTGQNQVYYILADNSRNPQQTQIRQQEVTQVLQMLNQSHPAAEAAQAVMNQRQKQQSAQLVNFHPINLTVATSGASHAPAVVTSTGYAPPISMAITPEMIAAASRAISSAIHVPDNQVPSTNISSPVTPNNRVAPPQRTQTTLTANRQYRLPNQPASPTTHFPNTSTTTSDQNQDLYLPSLQQVSSEQIQLPGGSKRQKVYDSEKDKAKFRFSKEYAMKPFRLVHDQSVTKKSFFVVRADFDRLFLHEDMLIKDQDKFPLTYIFTSWYNNTPERKCDWPNALRVELNGKDLPLEKRIRHRINSQNHSYTGKDLPFDMTKLIKLGENTLRIHQIGCACSYNFSVQIHKRHSENSLNNLIEKSTISIQTSESLIDSLLGNLGRDDDDEIVIIQESIKVSLKCPITMKRIKMPVRGKHCKHVDCFDFSAYLLMNENKNPSWICPRCNSLAYPDSLARDLLMESLLKKLPKNVSEIEYKENHKNFKITKMDDPDTDDEGDDDKDAENSDIDVDDSTTKDASETVKEEFAIAGLPALTNVIDLISDDEDEEEQAGIETTTTTNNNHVVTTTTTSTIVIPPFKRPRQDNIN